MWIFIWDNAPSKIFIWDSEVSKVFVWDTQVRPTSRLPSAYQEVEYIQSSWTQYFILWNQFKTSYKVVIDFQMAVIWWDYIPIWINNYGSGNLSYRYWIDAYNSYFHVNAWWDWISTIAEDTNRHTIIIDKNTAIADWTSYTINYSNYTYSSWIWVFCYNVYNAPSPSQFMSSNKLYKLDVYDENWNHIYDLVPCYRISDSVIWMYDLANNQFYTNQWSWSFTKWSDV